MKVLHPPSDGGWLCIETPAGLVQVLVGGPDSREITFRNVPAFVEQQGVEVDVPGFGRVRADIAYGGNYFALVDAGALGFSLCTAELPRLCSLGMILRRKLREVCVPVHPLAGPRSIDLVEFHAPAHSSLAHSRNVVVFGEGQFDRSPCGTGTCARMAGLHAAGLLGIDEPFIHESIIGTTFTGRLRGIAGIAGMGGRAAVVPEITAKAYVTGVHQFVIDADDPLKYGFKI
jgi:proline racemase